MLSRGRALAAVVLAVALTSLVPLLTKHPEDLAVYRLGGSAVLHGRTLYDQRIGPLGFTYPPFAALLTIPFAVVPFGVASVGLVLLSLASLGFLFRRVAAPLLCRLRTKVTLPVLVALLLLACCAPVRGNFWNGQINLELAALVLADVQGRRLRGVGVGLAAAIKLTPAIFVVYLALCGRRAEAGRASAVFVLVTSLTWLALPADSARYWLHELFAASGGAAGVGNEAALSNQSLHGLLLRSVGPHAANTLWLLLVPAALVVGLRAAMRLTRNGSELLAIGVVGVTGCVISPVSWVHHWLWAMPWLVGLASVARRPLTRAFVVVTSAVVLGWDLLPWDALPSWRLWTFLGQNDLVLCALAAGLFELRTVRRRTRDSRSKPADVGPASSRSTPGSPARSS